MNQPTQEDIHDAIASVEAAHVLRDAAVAKTTHIITEPDLSTIKEPMCIRAIYRITDDGMYAQAAQDLNAAKTYIEQVTQRFEEPAGLAFRLHRYITRQRANILEGANQFLTHITAEINRYDRARQEAARQLQERAQKELDARLALERQQAEEDAKALAPWDEAPTVAPVVAVPQVKVAPLPMPTGLAKRYKPWSYTVTDFAALVKAAAENPALLEALQPNDAYLKLKVKEMGADISKRFPGIEGVHEEIITRG